MPDLAAISAFLRHAPYLHAYELGDLDPAELPHCTWFASSPVDAVALVYRGLATPTLITLTPDNPDAALDLLASIPLPPLFYAHLTPGLETALLARCTGTFLGHHLKMGLSSTPPLTSATRLTPADAAEVQAFYALAYPTSYFEPAALSRGPYLAIRDPLGIAAIAGTHVYSPTQRVASLGNIATRPDARNRGHARNVTSALCVLLLPEIDTLGLNVRADNAAAIASYTSIGFTPRHPYNEWRFSIP